MEHPASEVPVVFGDEAVDEEFAEWLEMSHLVLVEPELLKTGGSGGKLVSGYLRAVKGKGRIPDGTRIIKLVAPSPDAAAEQPNHLSALDSGLPETQSFIDRHLVELDERTSWKMRDGSWVMFQHPAGDGAEDTNTLAELERSPRLPAVTAHIVGQILEGWNPKTGPAQTRPTAAEFVTELLGSRLEPHGPLRSWVHKWFGTTLDEQNWFSLAADSRPLPNPLSLGADSPFAEHRVRFAMRGRAHGDLHPGNIMVPVGESSPADAFWLVDLSRFGESALLARDPLHLLVCLIADVYLPHLSAEARKELITALVGQDARCDGQLVPQGLAALVTGVRQAMLDWGSSKNINPGWRQQWHLALQACALMVTARDRYPACDRWWFFQLAAEAGGAYLTSLKARFPVSAAVLDPAGLDVPPFHDALSAAPPWPEAIRKSTPSSHTMVAAAVATEPAARKAVPDMIQEIWDGFARTRQQLDGIRPSQLRSADTLALSRRATDFRMRLGDPSFLAPRPVDDAAAEQLRHIRQALREVAERATELSLVLGDNLQILALAMQKRPAVLGDLVRALDDLLDAVSAATEHLVGRTG